MDFYSYLFNVTLYEEVSEIVWSGKISKVKEKLWKYWGKNVYGPCIVGLHESAANRVLL